MNWYTSDFHLGSTNIIRYAKRPFKDAASMRECYLKICRNVDKSDRIFHVGDFILAGKDAHDGTTDYGITVEQGRAFLREIPNLVLLNGNHDSNHNFQAAMRCMVVNLGHHYRNVSVGHYPSLDPHYEGLDGSSPTHPQIHLCGHVHNAWLLKWDPIHSVLNVNIGPDVWSQTLVSESRLVYFLDYFFEYMFTLIKLDAVHRYTWTRTEYEKNRLAVEINLRRRRELRTEEKHAKKGLTPEECERRRIEAMKKKGLIK